MTQAGEPRDRRGGDQPFQVDQPGVPPQPAVEADQPEDGEFDREGTTR